MEIRIEDMSFGYDCLPVLQNVNLLIDRPGLVCIVGPNGVGKSTLIRCMNRLLKPTSGRIMVDGIDIQDVPYKNLSRIMGYVPVASNDAFSMTVLDTVMMGRYPYQKLGRASDLDHRVVKRTLNMMGIRHLSMRNFDELSAGQHQRVSIARGLAQTPRALILDEPTSNLDIRHQMQVTELLHNLAVSNDITVVMVSHDLNVSAKYADTIVMMALPGVVHKVGTPTEVLTEDNIRYVYGVECKVIEDDGRPHVILKSALPNEVIRCMYGN